MRWHEFMRAELPTLDRLEDLFAFSCWGALIVTLFAIVWGP